MTAKVCERRRTVRGSRATPCFLCLNPVTMLEREHAFVRVPVNRVPSAVDFAHEECAEQAGLWKEPEDEEEGWLRTW